jgi:hypothetical protein
VLTVLSEQKRGGRGAWDTVAPILKGRRGEKGRGVSGEGSRLNLLVVLSHGGYNIYGLGDPGGGGT